MSEKMVLALLASIAHARIDWNLESTFLMHLQEQSVETADGIRMAEDRPAPRIYPSRVSEGTCSTECVDIQDEKEYCVATSVCDQATWREAFDRLATHQSSLHGFRATDSKSHCEVWGNLNRCDGTLCGEDTECQSGCCGSFTSFTHNRCLPILGNYCAGRDTTRDYTLFGR